MIYIIFIKLIYTKSIHLLKYTVINCFCFELIFAAAAVAIIDSNCCSNTLELKPILWLYHSLSIKACNLKPCLLVPVPQGAIQHMSRPGGQPNARPLVLVLKQVLYSFYLYRNDERLCEPYREDVEIVAWLLGVPTIRQMGLIWRYDTTISPTSEQDVIFLWL